MFWYFLTPYVKSECWMYFWLENFNVQIIPMGSKKIWMLKVIFWLSNLDVLFDVLIFNVLIFNVLIFNILIFDVLIFRRSDHPKNTFKVLTLWCCDFWRSNPSWSLANANFTSTFEIIEFSRDYEYGLFLILNSKYLVKFSAQVTLSLGTFCQLL